MDLNRILMIACACLSVCGVGVLVLAVVVLRFGFSIVTDLLGGVLGGGGGGKNKNDSLSQRYGGAGFAAQTVVAPQITSFEEALARQQQVRPPTPLSPQAAPMYPPQQFSGQSVGQLMTPQQGYPQQSGYPPQPNYPQQPFPQTGFTQTNPGFSGQAIQPTQRQPSSGYGLPPTQPFPPTLHGNAPQNMQRPSLTPGVPYSPPPFPRSAGAGARTPFPAAEDPFGRDRATNRRAEDDRYEIYDDADDAGGVGLDIF